MQKMKQRDAQFFTTFNRRLNPANALFTERTVGRQVLEHQRDDVVANIGDLQVARSDISSYGTGHLLSKGAVNAVFRLLQDRDDHIATNYASVNEGAQLEYSKSLFLPVNVMSLLSENPDREDIFSNGGAESWANLHRVYFPYKATDNDQTDDWSLAVLDIHAKAVYVFHSKFDTSTPPIAEETTFIDSVRQNLLLLLTKILPTYVGAWNFQRCPHIHFDCQQNDFDSAIFVLTAAYFLANDCPIVMKAAYASRIRVNFAYWTLSDGLPQ